MARLLYATPTAQHPHLGYLMSVRALELTCRSFGERGVGDFQFSLGPTQMARSQIASLTMGGGYDFVVMHDDDLVIEAENPLGNPLDVWHAMMDLDPSIGVIGAVYLRERPRVPIATMPHPTSKCDMCQVICGLPARPFDVAGLGTGFMLIRAEVFRVLRDAEADQGRPPMFRFPLITNQHGLVSEWGEDYDFCRRAREAGFRVLADPRFGTVHLKSCGPLEYRHELEEASWTDGNAFKVQRLEDLRGQCGPGEKLIQHDGITMVDSTAQRELDAKAWREQIRKPKAA